MIGGNITGIIQQKSATTVNAIGERVQEWTNVHALRGFLDLMAGDSKYINDAKIRESTHIFICDYTAVDPKTDNKRMVINDETYDVQWIDDPMCLHRHLEIYLRKVG